jgi:hypothetical protein
MKHMQHRMKHTFETHENIRSSMPWSDGKIWASKRRLQMWARAPLTKDKRPGLPCNWLIQSAKAATLEAAGHRQHRERKEQDDMQQQT